MNSCNKCKHLEGCMIELVNENLNPDVYFCSNFSPETLASPTFPTEKAINKDLTATKQPKKEAGR